MPGYIDNSSDLALFESYSQGRALGAQGNFLSDFAQWSAVLDKRTCDWCSWADEKIFNRLTEPYDPPTHHGCRCLVAFIQKNEFPPNPDWSAGPPADHWPPGSYKVQRAAEKSVKAAPKPSGPLVGTSFEADALKSLSELEDMLRSRYGIEADFTGWQMERAREVARTIEKFNNAYPEYAHSLRNLGGHKSWNISNAMKADVASGGGADGVVMISQGKFIPTDMAVSARKISISQKGKSGSWSTSVNHEGVVWHELGHVAENWGVQSTRKTQDLLRRITAEIYDGNIIQLQKDITKYAISDGHELLGEFFHIANAKGGLASWATSAEHELRLRKILKFYNDNGIIIRESQLP